MIQLTQNAIQLTHNIHKTSVEDYITTNINISTKIQNNNTTSHKKHHQIWQTTHKD